MKALVSILLVLGMVSVIPTASAQSGFDYIMVFLNSNPHRADISAFKTDSLQKGHLDNIGRMAADGRLIAAGPFYGGGGIFIFNTTKRDSLNKWLEEDPAIMADRFVLEIYPLKLHNGKICPQDASAEMATYHFIRFIPDLHKDNVRIETGLLEQHDAFIKSLNATGNVIAQGILDHYDGGFIILKGDLDPEVIQADMAVTEGYYIPKLQKLWIAKGTFCEE